MEGAGWRVGVTMTLFTFALVSARTKPRPVRQHQLVQTMGKAAEPLSVATIVDVEHTELNLTVQLGLRVLILGTPKLRKAHHLGQSLAKGRTELRGTMS